LKNRGEKITVVYEKKSGVVESQRVRPNDTDKCVAWHKSGGSSPHSPAAKCFTHARQSVFIHVRIRQTTVLFSIELFGNSLETSLREQFLNNNRKILL
jgi:hypothetical protein